MYRAEHVAEDLLEEFALRDCVPEVDKTRVREHLSTCPLCQDRLPSSRIS